MTDSGLTYGDLRGSSRHLYNRLFLLYLLLDFGAKSKAGTALALFLVERFEMRAQRDAYAGTVSVFTEK